VYILPGRRPPILLDFEQTWENVLNDNNSPDWTAVETQHWRTWFEFYKAISKVGGCCLLLGSNLITSGSEDSLVSLVSNKE